MLPSFWFSPAMLKHYGVGIIRLSQAYLMEKVASGKTITESIKKLTQLNLGKYVHSFDILTYILQSKFWLVWVAKQMPMLCA